MKNELMPDLKPLIDVTFQLLIFFMITINFKTEEGNLNSFLPKDRGPLDEKVETPQLDECRVKLNYLEDRGTTKLEISNTGTTFFWPDDREVRDEERSAFGRKTADIYQKVLKQADGNVPPVKLDAAPDVPSGRVVTAMDILSSYVVEPHGASLQYSANTLSAFGRR